MTVTLHLSPAECELVAIAGVHRELIARHVGRSDYHNGAPRDSWEGNIEACGSEYALARHLGLPWVPWVRRLSDVPADVGSDIQVRRVTRERIPNPHLIVYPSDPPAHRFVLMAGTLPTYRALGWFLASDAQTPGYWKELTPGRPAFCVPSSELEPLSGLATVRAPS